MTYPEPRKLDGVFFRIKRDGQWHNICFSDLTEAEQNHVMAGRSEEWLKSLACILADVIRKIGDQFDIMAGHPGEEDIDSE